MPYLIEERRTPNVIVWILISIAVLIGLTVMAVYGFSHMRLDAAQVRRMDAETARQVQVGQAEAIYDPARAQAQAQVDIAYDHAEAIRAVGQAQDYVADLQHTNATTAAADAQRLARHDLILRLVIWLGAAAIVGVLGLVGLAVVRLINRRLPAPRLAAPAPGPTPRPTPGSAPHRPLTAMPPTAPQTLVLRVEDDAYRRAPQPTRPEAPRPTGQPASRPVSV